VADTVLDNKNNVQGQDDNVIVWDWTGKNRKGRTVGTGTYLFKAVCIAIRPEDGTQQKFDVQRSIGFVRGKD
jgi:flagellar hook assembly protein FlgD